MSFRATFAVGLAGAGVAIAALLVALAARDGAALLAVVPLVGCTIAWWALHSACARPSRAKDAWLFVVLVAVAFGSVMLVSFGGGLLFLSLPFFAASAIALPR